jgi:O-antigen biosynthesis protein WbqV
MIELSGCSVRDADNPDGDNAIEYTGLRPGEKMTEALFDVTETARECEPGLLEVIDDNALVRLSEAELKQLDAMARAGDDAAVRTILFTLLARLRSASTSNVTQLSRGV